MMTLDAVVKRYPDGHEALRGITLDIEDGEMVFITGRSGAGKSTLLRLMAGMERPTAGTLTINRQDINRLKPAALARLRRNIGLVFQDHKLLFDRSVFDNVQLPLQICGFDHKETGKRVRAALDKVGLLNREKANPIALSGGEQQRLCIARAIVNRPSILLADEPTGNLDAEYAQEIMKIFNSFHQVGATLLISTHDAGMLKNSHVRTICLKHGEIQPDESPREGETPS